MYEVVGPYLIEWSVVGEQCAAAGHWKGSWRVHLIGSRDCTKPVAEGTTDAKHSFCEALTLAQQQAQDAAAALCALE
ncbi:hypothetical protein JAK76_06575 [Stenotrophomonas maltophilia]|uniref:hypothetical protein n=1 Tax=Stenotrophomonas maltophilia TaxID=40324 RepID=UPI001FA809EB|nr:hypothetical protein [Stenotrophomonas maltophilia]MCU1008648.1 hypothetical protein [Stenotrophomonas maltophilia]